MSRGKSVNCGKSILAGKWANVFEVSAMAAKAAEAVDGSQPNHRSPPKIDSEIKP
jgi:hypothetical protein